MSDGELRRLEVLRDLDRRRLTTEAAAQLLRFGHRQVFRLLKAYRAEGATGLISKRRRRRSNRRMPGALRQAALALLRERYRDLIRPLPAQGQAFGGLMPPFSAEWPGSVGLPFSISDSLKRDDYSKGTVGAVQTFIVHGQEGHVRLSAYRIPTAPMS
jgi:hypothetical protein